MEVVCGLVFFVGIWLALLTGIIFDQRRKNKILRRNNAVYLQELEHLRYGKEREAEKTDQAKEAKKRRG